MYDLHDAVVAVIGILFVHGSVIVLWFAAALSTRHIYFSLLPASLFVWHIAGLCTLFIPALSGVSLIAFFAGPLAVPYMTVLSINAYPISGSAIVAVSALLATTLTLAARTRNSIGVYAMRWNLYFVMLGISAYLISYAIEGRIDVFELKISP